MGLIPAIIRGVFPGYRKSELLSAPGFTAGMSRRQGQRRHGAGYVDHPCCVSGMFRMRGVGQGNP
jgi:hypothetical protein